MLSGYAWPFRALVWYYRHPFVGYLLTLAVGVCWALLSASPEAPMFMAFALPWLAMGVVLLDLPFFGAVFRRMAMPIEARRNHALEHGTISLMLSAYGKTKGIGGKAAPDGFRISGAKSEADIRRAFSSFVALPRERKAALAVSNRCGSMLAVAEGLAMLLVVVSAIVIALWPLSELWIASIFAGQFSLYLAARRPLGRLLQRKRLLSLDFETAQIHKIAKVRVRPLFEKPPVYFVSTRVQGAV